MIRRIQALNYRCFRHLDIDLDRFHLLIGPNGGGKRTLIDTVLFLGDLVRLGPEAAVDARAGDFRDLVRGRPERGGRFEIAVEFVIPERCVSRLPADRDFGTYRYEIAMGRDADGVRIEAERGVLMPPPARLPPRRRCSLSPGTTVHNPFERPARGQHRAQQGERQRLVLCGDHRRQGVDQDRHQLRPAPFHPGQPAGVRGHHAGNDRIQGLSGAKGPAVDPGRTRARRPQPRGCSRRRARRRRLQSAGAGAADAPRPAEGLRGMADRGPNRDPGAGGHSGFRARNGSRGVPGAGLRRRTRIPGLARVRGDPQAPGADAAPRAAADGGPVLGRRTRAEPAPIRSGRSSSRAVHGSRRAGAGVDAFARACRPGSAAAGALPGQEPGRGSPGGAGERAPAGQRSPGARGSGARDPAHRDPGS